MTMTSYITVATPSRNRYFDLDAVRTPAQQQGEVASNGPKSKARENAGVDGVGRYAKRIDSAVGGAPPLDWFHETDATIDAAINPPRETYEGPPMTAQFLVGDVYERMRELPDHSFDLIITSPPFLALRSYLPDDHPDKAKEIGSESTPADYLDVLLALTAEWRRLLAPHGSIAVELGDTYAGSGGAGGDYNPDGLRDGQPKFHQHIRRERRPEREGTAADGGPRLVPVNAGNGWPLDKSLCGIPTLYAWSLAYGRNLLTGRPSPAGQWRIRNLKPWIRSNPPVGALGDKERPATSYITVATVSRDRWFDLDAVRQPLNDRAINELAVGGISAGESYHHDAEESGYPTWRGTGPRERRPADGGGAPPLDWWHHVDAIIDHEINQRARDAGKDSLSGAGQKRETKTDGGWSSLPPTTKPLQGARGVHIRRALERAGVFPKHPDALDVSPKGYAGAHYAVWPPELVRLLVDEMCPRKVCDGCGEPSRRSVDVHYSHDASHANGRFAGDKYDGATPEGVSNANAGMRLGRANKNTTTLGWSDCGHDNMQCQACKVLVPYDHAICRSRTTPSRQTSVSQEALLGESGEISGRQAEASAGVRGVPDRLLGSNGNDAGVQSELFSEARPSGRPIASNPADDPDAGPEGEPPRLREGVGAARHAGPPTERLHDGASTGDAGTSRPTVGPVGDSSPPQRDNGRQPARESGSGDSSSPRRDGDLSPLSGDVPGQLTCPSCGAAALVHLADHWRPGRILDPFVGSGTTLAVATGMGRDAVGIDLDPRNAHLAEQRCGMFLEVDWGRLEPTTELPPDEVVVAVSDELL